MISTRAWFRIASATWVAGGFARPAFWWLYVAGHPDSSELLLPAFLFGAALCFGVAAFLWLRPGRLSAGIAVLLGFYAIPSLLYVQIPGMPPSFAALVALSLASLVVSAYCLWRTRHQEYISE